MENLFETYKSIKQYYNLLLTIIATGFILLLSTKENVYEKPLNELTTLRNLEINKYEQYIRGFCGGNDFLPIEARDTFPYLGSYAFPNLSSNIAKFIISLYRGDGETLNLITEEFPNPDWEVVPIVEYDKPPVDGTMTEWKDWIKSTNSAKYYKPNWESAQLSWSRLIGTTPSIIRHFLLKQSEFKRNPGEYTFRAYLDLKINQNDTSQYVSRRSKRYDWWTKYDTLTFQTILELEGDLRDSIDNDSRFIIKGDVNSDSPQNLQGTGVYNWLSTSEIWSNISSYNELGESILPGLHSVWADVSNKTIDGAFVTLLDKKNNSKTLSIFGLSVSFLLALILVPVAFLFAEIFLLMHLHQLNKEIAKVNEQIVYPWIGAYNFLLAKITSVVIFAVLPFTLCIVGILRYFDWIGIWSLVIALILSIFVGITGVCVELENRKLRRVNIRSAANKE